MLHYLMDFGGFAVQPNTSASCSLNLINLAHCSVNLVSVVCLQVFETFLDRDRLRFLHCFPIVFRLSPQNLMITSVTNSGCIIKLLLSSLHKFTASFRKTFEELLSCWAEVLLSCGPTHECYQVLPIKSSEMAMWLIQVWDPNSKKVVRSGAHRKGIKRLHSFCLISAFPCFSIRRLRRLKT